MMLGRFRSALYNAIGGLENGENGYGAANGNEGVIPSNSIGGSENGGGSGGSHGGVIGPTSGSRLKFAYQRPVHLQLFSDDEIQVSADHLVRPILVPRDVRILPWFAGYAEAINAGKSLRNEDQATFHRGVLRICDTDLDENDIAGSNRDFEIPYVYFGIFDGHAGSGCAVAASNELHQVVHHKLLQVMHHFLPDSSHGDGDGVHSMLFFPNREISTEALIIGALESAFWDMDKRIGEDKKRYKMLGGCTVLVSLFILGKLYVANAGDSRSVLCRNKVAYPMSYDFTPVSERQRLQQLGYQKPHLLGDEYTHLDFCRKPMRKDLGKHMLYRDAHMTGWTYKEISQEDLKFPVVYGEGKRSRLLATIGVTRGFGDHDLRAQSQNGYIYIKPFLTPQPEVRVLDIESESSITAGDVLVMATDGLWDVVSNERVAEIVDKGLDSNLETSNKSEDKAKYRYISIAQDLVMAARGKLQDRNWRRSDGTAATIDDISVFAIPIIGYKEEYLSWKIECDKKKKNKREVDTNKRGIETAVEVKEDILEPPLLKSHSDLHKNDEEEDSDDVELENNESSLSSAVAILNNNGKKSESRESDDDGAEK